MSETREQTEKERRREARDHFYSCAFCHQKSPKPFRICESCGSAQPDESEE